MIETLERLAAANIQLLPAVELTTHFVFERDGFIALVERRENGFGAIGSGGLLTGKGFAPLIQRGGEAFFVGKGFEQRADAEQIERLRSFQTDLNAALAEPRA